MFNGARIVGPAAAGILMDRYGVPIAFLLGSISELFGVSAAYGLGGGLALLCIGSLALWWRRGRIRGSAVAV